MESLRHPQLLPARVSAHFRPLTGRKWQRLAGIRNWLLVIVGVILVPVALLALFLILQVHRAEESATQRELAQRTVATAYAVQERLDIGISFLSALAVSDAALNSDFQALYNQAKQVAESFPGATGIGLVGQDVKFRFMTARPWGTTLGTPPDTSTSERVFATGAPAVSGIFKGPYTGKSVVTLGVPVVQNGHVAFTLLMVLTSESLSNLLLAQQLPLDWVASIIDQKSFIAARTLSADVFVGTESTPELKAFLQTGRSGQLELVTKENIPVLSYVERTASYQWAVAVGVPKENLTAPLYRHLALLLGLALLIFALGFFFAGRAGKALERWISLFGAAIRSMKAGFDVQVPVSGIRELDQMARSLNEVNEDHGIVKRALQKSLSERDEANLALELARMDGLTGLRARTQFREDFSAMRLQLPHDHVLALLFVDLDRFKSVNDRFGHEAGDQMLIGVAQVFAALESSSCIAARWGGDEFVLAFSAPPERLNALMISLCVEITANILKLGLDLGCSIGVAFWDERCSTLNELVKLADQSMYRQKHTHRNPM